MKIAVVAFGVVAGFLAVWPVWGTIRDRWRQDQAQNRLKQQCLKNLSDIQGMLLSYQRDHGEFPANLASLREYSSGNDFPFRCRLCYDFKRTIFALDGAGLTTDFGRWEGFQKFSYAFVTSANSKSNSNQLWVFCVGLHPDAHVLFRGGQVTTLQAGAFWNEYKAVANQIGIYPTNFWAAPSTH